MSSLLSKLNRLIYIYILSFIFYPCVTQADGSSLSFTPPITDYSVVFLADLFGVVDGVLNGTGSQLMGALFGVFNAAVLALGGIIIMYTLIVGTMNTAAEGTMLGQKWNSIWIPVRSTIGLALLIPKASGYCLMQIFVMWVVVQGVGAADKIWNAALEYLNRGGVIIHQQSSSFATKDNNQTAIVNGAAVILDGVTCMSGLQTLLEAQRKAFLNDLNNNTGPCYYNPTAPGINALCTTAVPDFIASIDVVSYESNLQQSINNGSTSSHLAVPMPNFDASSPYAGLNKICGTIMWNALSAKDFAMVTQNMSNTVSSSEVSASELSRAVAIQQMIVDLSSTGKLMVGNDPTIITNSGDSSNFYNPYFAVQQYGLPYLSGGTSICPGLSTNCNEWMADSSSQSYGMLLNGTELFAAVTDYDGIMQPTINLINQAKDSNNANKDRAFIQGAEAQGWLMAGSYFFNVEKLNGSAGSKNEHGSKDSNSGLEGSFFDTASLTRAFPGNRNDCKTSSNLTLCNMFGGNPTAIKNLVGLFDGSNDPNIKKVLKPTFSSTSHPPQKGAGSSTVYGYINNAYMITLPGQPGLAPKLFNNTGYEISFNWSDSNLALASPGSNCFSTKDWGGCIGRAITDSMFGNLFKLTFGAFQEMINQYAKIVLETFLAEPLTQMLEIFQAAANNIKSNPGVNPIIALANMGTSYINFCMDMWIELIEVSIFTAMIPIFGTFIFALISLAMPLLIAWLGTMMSIGFMTAYYVPFLPYITFTFGSIAWFMVVIEAMVAAPIIAIGVTHPEGDGALGKGEHGLMILLNIFLRPAMMIIGYVAAISLCYVGVWLLNAGYENVNTFLKPSSSSHISYTIAQNGNQYKQHSGGYSDWAGIYANFFSILMYVSLYLVIVQRAFELIYLLPDKVLRWIGGHPEEAGQRTAQWAEESKNKLNEAGKATGDAGGQMGKQLSGYAKKGFSALSGSSGPDIGAGPS